LARLARERGLAIVEDACHAIGGDCRNGEDGFVPIGSCAHSDLAVFSFHPVKTIATGEGGAVTTRDEALARRLALLRSHGITHEPGEFASVEMGFERSGAVNPWYYEMPEFGWNYRLSDIHAALGLSQLARLARFVAERRRLASLYDAALAPLAPALRPIARSAFCRPAWHLYPVLVDFAGLGFTRAALMRFLHEAGIGSQVHYIPVHRQPYYRARYGTLELPGADAYYARALSLPLFVGMSGRDVAHVAGMLARALAELPGAES
jgi:dTDP-4-amino-4,6-dideoxygalactose transaminase